MAIRMIVQEVTIPGPDGRAVTYFDIYDVVSVEGHELLHKRSDVGFKTREVKDTA